MALKQEVVILKNKSPPSHAHALSLMAHASCLTDVLFLMHVVAKIIINRFQYKYIVYPVQPW